MRRTLALLALPIASIACVSNETPPALDAGGFGAFTAEDAATPAEDASTADATTHGASKTAPDSAMLDASTGPDTAPVPQDASATDATIADGSIADSAPTGDTSTPSDAAPEAAPDAGVPVVVTVVGAAGVEPGVTIVFDDPSGALLGTQTTDASGRASGVVAAGGSVTALLGDPNMFVSPITIAGVVPGDALTVVDWGSFPTRDVGTRALCTSVDS